MLTLMKPYDPDLGTKLGLFVHFSETSRANKDQNTQTGELVWARERARTRKGVTDGGDLETFYQRCIWSPDPIGAL